jgi:aldose 1-epimerase
MAIESFGVTRDGEAVQAVRLRGGGSSIVVLTYGAAIAEWRRLEPGGESPNLTLGLPTLAEYEAHRAYFGCAVGRFCNRIAGGAFELDGRRYQLACNDGDNHLHGGLRGFNRRVWRLESATESGVMLALTSPDGEEGYPGTLEVTCAIALDQAGALGIEFRARTDAPTVVNLTNHAYFHLGGEGSGTVEDHELRVAADAFTERDPAGVPTGEVREVAGTVVDFRDWRRLGDGVHATGLNPPGFDYNFVVRGQPGTLREAARLRLVPAGRELVLRTTAPGMQLYTANYLDGTTRGRNGLAHEALGGVCLESQNFPNAVNEPRFPSAVLRPGEEYVHRMEYAVSNLPAA